MSTFINRSINFVRNEQAIKFSCVFTFVVFAVIWAMPSMALGTVLVSQPPVVGGGVARSSQLWQDPSPAGNNLDGDAVCWEDFTLNQAAAISHFEWCGNGASELGFQIEFWRQDPGTIAYQPLGVFYYGQGNPPVSPEPPGFITVTPADYVTSIDTAGLTHFVLDLASSVNLAANNSGNPRWFIGIVGLTAQPFATWNWAQDSSGSAHTFQFIRGGTPAGGDLFHELPDGRALILGDATVVPEPDSLMLLAAAALTIAGFSIVRSRWSACKVLQL